MKNSSSARIVTSGWCDPLQIVLDEDVKDNRSQADFSRQIWETWGYGSYTPATTFTSGNVNVIDGPGGADTGVWPIQYFCDNQNPGLENANLYLPTIESEDYLLRGSWGTSSSKLVVLVNEVLPQGNIFG